MLKEVEEVEQDKQGREARTPEPNKPWKSISRDFIIHLPDSRKLATRVVYDTILLVVDSLTRHAFVGPVYEG